MGRNWTVGETLLGTGTGDGEPEPKAEAVLALLHKTFRMRTHPAKCDVGAKSEWLDHAREPQRAYELDEA